MRGLVLPLSGLAACVSFAGAQNTAFLGDVHNTNNNIVDEDAVPVGIGNLRPACNTGSTGVGCSVGASILAALEADDLVTVTNVEMGELNCETFERADGAEQLDFTLSAGQVVTARMTSFKTLPGDAFTNNVERKVWTGVVDEPEGSVDLPMSVSMTWSGCDIQSFIMKAIIPSKDGSIKTITSIPSGVDSNGVFMLDIYREGEDESDITLEGEEIYLDRRGGGQRQLAGQAQAQPTGRDDNNGRRPKRDARLVRENRLKNLEARKALDREVEEGVKNARLRDPDHDEKDADIRLLQEYRAASPEEKEGFHGRGLRRIDEDNVSMPSGRVLQDSDKPHIDVMVLYTKKAMLESNSLDGAVRSNDQMESAIIAAYEGANNALADSGIGFTLNVVYMAQVDYTETSDVSDAVYGLQRGDHEELLDVHALRDEYGADLVQLVGFYLNTCGIGFTMQSPTSAFDGYGYSVVHVNCLSNFSHIHEIGHNMGANHNKENSNSDHAYAYAWRYCTGDTPYRTLMAYATDCSAAPRVNIFSTPDKSYAGQPQGTDTADNARVLNEAMSTVVNFREDRGGGSSPTSPVPAPGPSAPTPGSGTPPAPAKKTAGNTPESATTTTSIYPEKIFEKKMRRKGCFRDDSDDRVMTAGTDMPSIEGKTIGMTRDNCMAYCYNQNKRFKYFGVEYGEECFCWKNNKRYKRKGKLDNSACNVECAGDGETTCGGRDALEVFKMKSVSLDEQDVSPSYQGCYRDTSMDNLLEPDCENENPEACHDTCKSGGYAYYGLENGCVCSCGNILPDDSERAGDIQCSMPCASPNTEETCGGSWHMAIYSTNPAQEKSKAKPKQSDAPSGESGGAQQPPGGALGGALSGADGAVDAGGALGGAVGAGGAEGASGAGGAGEAGGVDRQGGAVQQQAYSTDDSSTPYSSMSASSTSSVLGDNYGAGGGPTDVQLEDIHAQEAEQP